MISSPDLTDSRSRLADWLEVRAIFSGHGAGEADIISIARLTSDVHRDREVDEIGVVVEQEILDSDIQEHLARVSEEIGHRAESLGADYPFVVQTSPLRVAMKSDEELTVAHWAYLFMLFLSAERDKFPTKIREDCCSHSRRADAFSRVREYWSCRTYAKSYDRMVWASTTGRNSFPGCFGGVLRKVGLRQSKGTRPRRSARSSKR